jgi:hypothetical protein
MEQSIDDALTYHLAKSYSDFSYFNSVILGRPHYWYKQRLIADSIVNNSITCVVSGNGIGKTHCIAGCALAYLYTRPDSIVITTAPTGNSLREVLWGQIRTAFWNARFPLGGEIISSPLEKLMPAGKKRKWFMLGITTTKEDKLSGFHGKNVLIIADEASGVSADIFSAIDGINPERLVLIGNPLRCDGYFYELCLKASSGQVRNCGYIQVSSLESPHINEERSPWGLADKDWLQRMEDKWGRNSTWWTSHILGNFPSSNEDSLIHTEWLDKLAPVHMQAGNRHIAIDVAEGRGGDDAVIITRDDNGIFDDGWWSSNRFTFDDLANQVKKFAVRYKVSPSHITFDAHGSGNDFAHRLRGVGLTGARPYKAQWKTEKVCQGVRLRDNAAWSLRRRLDPTRQINSGDLTKRAIQPAFYIPKPFMMKLRPELQVLTYSQTSTGQVELRTKEHVKRLLGRSSDYSDALIMSFCYHRPYN